MTVSARPATDAAASVARPRLPLVVWVVAIRTFLMATSEFLVAGVLPEVARDFRIDVGSAGLAITVFAIGMVIGSPTLVLLTLRLPRRATLILFTVVGLTGLSINPILGFLAMRFGGSAPTLANALTPSAFNVGTAVGTGVTASLSGSALGDVSPVLIGLAGSALVLIGTTALTLLHRRRAGRMAPSGSADRATAVSSDGHRGFARTISRSRTGRPHGAPRRLDLRGISVSHRSPGTQLACATRRPRLEIRAHILPTIVWARP